MLFEIWGRIANKMTPWAVDSQGRGQVLAASESEDRHINQLTGNVWSASMKVTTAFNAGAYIAYMTNVGDDPLHLTDMRAHCTVATVIDIDKVTVGSTLTNNSPWLTDSKTWLTSRNMSKTHLPEGTTEYANAVAGITGLTKTGVLFHAGSLDNKTSHLSTSSNVIIYPGTSVAIKLVTAQTAGVTITFSVVKVKHES